MRYLVKRNLMIFFRDKGSVFYSLLSVIIIVGLYILFLGDLMVKGVGDVAGARFLMDSWIMAGLVSVTPFTTALGGMSSIIIDKKYGLYKDFAASPLKRSVIAGSYIVSGFFISLILTLLTFILGEVYIVVYGGKLLAAAAVLKTLLMILLTTATSSILMFYLVTSFKSINAYSAASTVIGTLIGFLTGIYIPIGNLPEAVQTVIKLFPPSHVALLMRRIMMEQAEQIVFAGAKPELMEAFRVELGSAFRAGDKLINPVYSILYVCAFIVVFFILSLIRIRKKED
ncbi:MAG TPA: ABC transporter permease [Clostridiales bacterium]|nr:ABC transporter permease [Clostridiales bacterium]